MSQAQATSPCSPQNHTESHTDDLEERMRYLCELQLKDAEANCEHARRLYLEARKELEVIRKAHARMSRIQS